MTGRSPGHSRQGRFASLAAAARGLLFRLGGDRSGLGAVEFAMIAPLLLMLYITAFEVTVGLSVAKRATRTAGAVADLTTQNSSSVNVSQLGTMKDVANAIFAPYSTAQLSLQITGIAVDDAGKATVKWSWAEDGKAAHAKNAAFDLPADIATPGSFLVHARVSVPHKILMFMPGLMPSEMQSITITREYYFRQRINESVDCSDCP